MNDKITIETGNFFKMIYTPSFDKTSQLCLFDDVKQYAAENVTIGQFEAACRYSFSQLTKDAKEAMNKMFLKPKDLLKKPPKEDSKMPAAPRESPKKKETEKHMPAKKRKRSP